MDDAVPTYAGPCTAFVLPSVCSEGGLPLLLALLPLPQRLQVAAPSLSDAVELGPRLPGLLGVPFTDVSAARPERGVSYAEALPIRGELAPVGQVQCVAGQGNPPVRLGQLHEPVQKLVERLGVPDSADDLAAEPQHLVCGLLGDLLLLSCSPVRLLLLGEVGRPAVCDALPGLPSSFGLLALVRPMPGGFTSITTEQVMNTTSSASSLTLPISGSSEAAVAVCALTSTLHLRPS